MRRIAIFFAVCTLAAPIWATPADEAREALALLDAAAAKLEEADTSRDRVRALTETIAAYEAGLSALRGGLRQVGVQQAELSRELQAHDGEVAALLAALQRVGGTGSPIVLLHPAGPIGTVRAGMLVADLAPALDVQAADLRQNLIELEALQTLQKEAEARLKAGLQEVQSARTALGQAVANRKDLPKRFLLDPVNEAILIDTAQSLSEFALGLDQMIAEDVTPARGDITSEKGALPLPVDGQVRRRAGERDAAGVIRPGIILETAPNALVTTPFPATIRYAGPLLDLDQVVILEPQSDVLFVLSGMETVFWSAGDMIEAQMPVGLMGDGIGKNEAVVSIDGDETGTGRRETLYIEIRENNVLQDPLAWFRAVKDG